MRNVASTLLLGILLYDVPGETGNVIAQSASSPTSLLDQIREQVSPSVVLVLSGRGNGKVAAIGCFSVMISYIVSIRDVLA